MKAELANNAGGPAELPGDGLPEVVIAGRSNVGKSSFINALLGRKRLARTSARPGKTRRIHFYRIDGAFYLVDLPGFGYAAVSQRERRSWRPLVESYLRGTRREIVGAILLVDLRRGLEREEVELLDWLDAEEIPAELAFTKSDTLSASRAERRLHQVSEGLGLSAERIACVSSRDGRGLGRVAGWIRAWTGTTLLCPDGTPLER